MNFTAVSFLPQWVSRVEAIGSLSETLSDFGVLCFAQAGRDKRLRMHEDKLFGGIGYCFPIAVNPGNLP